MVDGIRVKINRAGPRPDYQGDERQVRQYLTCGSDMYSPPCLLHVLHLQCLSTCQSLGCSRGSNAYSMRGVRLAIRSLCQTAVPVTAGVAASTW